MTTINVQEVKDFIQAQGPNTKIYLGGDSERFRVKEIGRAHV